jgi:hypothetical protein
MPTVTEILRQTGFSDDEIAMMDGRATAAFGNILNTAEAERQRAEAERAANVEFYETKVMPGLIGFDEERAQLEAARVRAEKEAAWLRGAAQSAGILPAEEPPRDGQGRFVAGAPGSIPGSPALSS